MQKVNQELLKKYEVEVRKIWKTDEKMVNYCLKEVSNLVELSDGSLYEIEKKRIKTRFCFGHGFCGVSSIEDEKRANEMAYKARRDYDYFMEENLQGINEMLEWLQDEDEAFYTTNRYINKDVKISNVVNRRYIHNFGNSAIEYKPLQEEDKEKLVKAYQEEKEKFTKRLRTYLKRYGLKSVRSWSYLVD